MGHDFGKGRQLIGFVIILVGPIFIYQTIQFALWMGDEVWALTEELPLARSLVLIAALAGAMVPLIPALHRISAWVRGD